MKLNNNKFVFFRNDDVRETLDESLIHITDIFLSNNIPITHAVEPANMTEEVINWLNNKYNENPNLIEIIQHGYNHNKLKKYINQEFGGKRNYQDQYEDIYTGKKLMDNYFKENWRPVFSFPYGKFNSSTIDALHDLNFNGISSSVSFNLKNFFKNQIGTILEKDDFFNKRVSYHNRYRRKNKLFEVSVSINIIKKYLSYDLANHFSKEEIISKIKNTIKFTDIIGILFHHRFHFDQYEMIQEIIKYLKDNGFIFTSITEYINGKNRQY